MTPIEFSFSFAVVGFFIGLAIGFRFQGIGHQGVPLAFGAFIAFVFYHLAFCLLYFLLSGVVLSLIVLTFRFYGDIIKLLESFAQAAGRNIRGNYTRDGRRAVREFNHRLSFFQDLPVDHPTRDRLVKGEMDRFTQSIEKLGSQRPYVNTETARGGSAPMNVEDLFEME